MSNDSAESTSNEPAEKPARNPVERVIVWGGIGLLLAVAGIEARAQRGYGMSLDAVQAAFADNEEVEMNLDEARKLMALAPAETNDSESSGLFDYYRFSWLSLFKSGEYEITLKVTSDDMQVISFATPAAPQPDLMMEPPLEGDASISEEGDSGFGGNPGGGFSGGGSFGGGGSSFGGGSFQPPPNPIVTRLDVDGDNELSAEEIAGSPAALLALDANGDGELTVEEFAPEGFGQRGGGQGGFASGGGSENESGSSRPRRPEIEE